LLPGWVYIASKIALGTGGLLPHRFTLTHALLNKEENGKWKMGTQIPIHHSPFA